MSARGLRQLNAAARRLMRGQFLAGALSQLKVELASTAAPFVWTTIALGSIPCALPGSVA